jgi:hypothetical protein
MDSGRVAMIQVMVRAALVLVAGGIAMAAGAQNYSDGYKFLKAVRDRDGTVVTEMLERPGSTVIDAREVGSGENALQIVIARQDIAWLGFLLSKGANPNQQDDAGNPPLMQAVEGGFADGVRRLLTAKANINLPNRSGETPLIRAVQKRDVGMVRLLIANGADADRRDVIAGMSARDYAKADNRTPAILKLIEEDKSKPAKGMSGPVL